MAGSATDYLENKLLDHALATTTFNKPTNVYVGLFTVAPVDAGTGGTEVSGGSYARQLATFGSASGGSASNNTNIDFTNMPTCTIVAVGVFTANTATADDLIFWGTLAANRALVSGDSVRIATGALVVSLD